MKKNNICKKIGRKFGKNIGKIVVEMFSVVLVCSMVLGAVNVVLFSVAEYSAQNIYIEKIMYHAI